MGSAVLQRFFYSEKSSLHRIFHGISREIERENRWVMAIKRNGKKFQWCRRVSVLSVCALMCFGQGCYDQEVVERDTFGDLPDADEYKLDIYLISELAGRFLAYEKTGERSGKLVFGEKIDENGCRELKGIEYKEESEEPNNGDVDEINFDEINASSKMVNVETKLENGKCKYTIKYYPYMSDGKTEEDFNPKVVVYTEMGESGTNSVLKYTYAASGVDNIYHIWDSVYGYKPKEERNTIRIGSGDSYGVSIPQSSAFNDIPTIQLLNDIAFTHDTFGNHSFDKNLEFLNNIIEEADYQYVSSNMAYMAQNLNNKARRYAIYEVKPEKEGKEPLRLAVFGATDPGVVRSVFPGRFGTIEFGKNYCELLQAMELAYNRNARAFLILGHIYDDPLFMNKFLNELFLLNEDKIFRDNPTGLNITKESFFFDNVAGDKDDDFDVNLELYEYTANVANYCPSRLIIDDDEISRLEKFHSGKTKNELRDMLIVKKRKDIFSGLIGVFGNQISGAAGLFEYKKFASKDYQDWSHGVKKMYAVYRQSQAAVEKTEDADKGERVQWRNKLKQVDDRKNDLLLYNGLWFKYDEEDDEKNEDFGKGISYFYIPQMGDYTGKLTVVLKRKEDGKEGFDNSGFESTITTMEAQPVVGELFTDDKPSNCTEIKTSDDGVCKEYFASANLDAGIIDMASDSEGDEQAPDSKGDSDNGGQNSQKSIEAHKASELVTNEKFHACYEHIQSYVPGRDRDDGKLLKKVEKLRNIDREDGHSYEKIFLDQLRWACAYNMATKISCKETPGDLSCEETDDAYYSPTVFDFLHEGTNKPNLDVVVDDSKNKIRSQTTVTGNIVTTAIWDFLNGKEVNKWRHLYQDKDEDGKNNPSEKGGGSEQRSSSELQSTRYDVVYLHAGSIVAGEKYSKIDTNWARQRLPFGNSLMAIMDTDVSLLVKFIQHGASKETEGSFPVVGGIVFSYALSGGNPQDNDSKNDNNGKTADVCEIWKTNETIDEKEYKIELTELYYYNDDDICNNRHFVKISEDGCESDLCKLTVESSKDPVIPLWDDFDDDAVRYQKKACVNNNDDVNESEKDCYYSLKYINMLIPDYIATGGDSYGTLFEYTSEFNTKPTAINSHVDGGTMDDIVLEYYKDVQKAMMDSKTSSNFTQAFRRAMCTKRLYQDDTEKEKSMLDDDFCRTN